MSEKILHWALRLMVALDLILTVGDHYFLGGRLYRFLGQSALQDATDKWLVATSAVLPLWLILEWVRYYRGPTDDPQVQKWQRGLALDTILVAAYFAVWLWLWLTNMGAIPDFGT